MRTEVRVTGAADVERILTQVGPRAARNLMRSTVHGMAGEVRSAARRDAPEKEGDLRRAIKVKRRRGTPTTFQSDVIVDPAGFYWIFHEFGTRKMASTPFFTPALEDMRRQAVGVFMRQFGRRFEAQLRRAARNGG